MLTRCDHSANVTFMSNDKREINRSRIERIKSAFDCKTDADLIRKLRFSYRTGVSRWVARGWFKTTEILIDALLDKNKELETKTKKLERRIKMLEKKQEIVA